ncbi:putative thioesterase PNKD isoform X2 [Tubulanus polymorphus]
MAKQGSTLFKIGYFFYTRTRLGYFYYRRDVTKANQKYENGHSVVEPLDFDGGLRILPIPISLDNYCYLIKDMKTGSGVLIDPADPDAIQPILTKEEVNLQTVLTTHKHWDHSGGNKFYKSKYRNVQIVGNADDHVPDVTKSVVDNEEILIPNSGLKFTAIFTPGHTVGHVTYLLDGKSFNAPNSLFCGDHLFIGGCGRMFEETAATMQQSLDRISNLHEDTLLWPGHEYALDNLEFARYINPNNQKLQEKHDWVKTQREKRLSTVPSSIWEEKQYNPFLRTDDPMLLSAIGLLEQYNTEPDSTRVQMLLSLRQSKDKFKYKL